MDNNVKEQVVNKARTLARVIDARPTADGAGVRIRRIAGPDLNALLDPFLMLDEIRSDDGADYIGGFPPHPHRGFETITYMLDGSLQHRDHMGNEGLLGPGGVQWMTAGRGVIHSEMPQQEQGLMHGYQIWLNLPAKDKMRDPGYRDYAAAEFPRVTLASGVDVTVIAGAVDNGHEVVVGPATSAHTEPALLDVTLPAGVRFEWPVASDRTVLVYVISGALDALSAGQMGVFRGGDHLSLDAREQSARVLVLAGRPLREPIKQYGPFVMNTVEQIEQALADYRDNRLVN